MHAASCFTPCDHVDFDAQLISGDHGAAEACALNSCEYNELAVAIRQLAHQQNAPSLRHGLDHQDAGHDGQLRKVSLEERLVDGHIFQRDDAFLRIQLYDAVDQQEREAVRQNAHDGVGIHQNGVGRSEGLLCGGCFGNDLCGVSHVKLFKSEIILDAPRRRQIFQPLTFWTYWMKTTTKAIQCPMADYLKHFEARRGALVETIRQMVEMESPSDNKAAVDKLGQWLGARFEKLGGKVTFHEQKKFGDHLQADFPAKAGVPEAKPILLLGHFDTVYELGALAKMPCKLEKGSLYGPGVFDMKSGIAFMLHAIEALQILHGGLPRPVRVLLVTDEEVGSDSSRAITERLAKQCASVFVLEPSAGPKGALKTARKGVGEYTVRVTGQASHAGLDPFKGQSAIVELAHQITRIAAFGEAKRGLTLNVGIIRGGTRTNVIAAEASADVDVRVERLSDAAKIDRKMRALKPVNRKCKLEVAGGLNRPPMERSARTAALFAKARQLALEIGWKLEETAVGGGSDGNFTAALGIPTLDGLGGVGDGAHASHEHVLVEALPRRAALIAGLLAHG